MLREFGLIIKLLACILFITFFGEYIPTPLERTFFTISLIIKELLVFSLPFIIFVFVTSCLLSFGQRGPLLIFSIFGVLTVSNFVGLLFGYSIGNFFLGDFAQTVSLFNDASESALKPWFAFALPKLIPTDYALLAGLVFGIVGTFTASYRLVNIFVKLKGAINFGFSKIFIPLLPIYISGFLIDMAYQGSLINLFKDYGAVLILVVVAQVLVILALFLFSAQGNPKRFMEFLKNALPSGLVGFSTMSSAATMPVTMKGADKNTDNSGFAHIFIPLSANIHQIGDCLAIPIFMVAIQGIFGLPPLSMETLLFFTVLYALTKFGNAGVPGGSVIVLMPIFQQHLGYDAQMSGLMTMLYVLMDPAITATNVMSNGAYTIFLNGIYCKWFHGKSDMTAALASK
ncbi:Cation:dicarboxylase symporter family transporter [Candidatus Bealeia paramacronuclearis]|uniref:Cation:dicarboxylase symporter family transporter n=1 Tax=Candidatus Bealeia paramacronuclearis TaxID=1921001 RepID=A0ABZ2C5C9_9PROT|nr:Cation:dicarboxylase symporter family transporter [Candidatus Bealeia paramacronuclearis]